MMMDNKNKKHFTTYKQQLEILKNKKLIIDDENKAIKLLKENSYFDLISGYKKPFKNKDGNYKNNTTINDIFALYQFDENLRYLILKNILIIEKHIKSLLSYEFTNEYGELQSEYLNPINYKNDNIRNMFSVVKLIEILKSVIDPPYDYIYIKHQNKYYGNIPLWVVMKTLSFGKVSKMYSLLKQNIQVKISKEFNKINESDLINMLNLLSRFRNVCAHNERLFNYKYKKAAIHDTYIHKSLIKNKNGQYVSGKCDLFAVIIALKLLLHTEQFNFLFDELKNLIIKLRNQTKQIQYSQLLKYMGFPSDWELIKNI